MAPKDLFELGGDRLLAEILFSEIASLWTGTLPCTALPSTDYSHSGSDVETATEAGVGALNWIAQRGAPVFQLRMPRLSTVIAKRDIL